MWWDASRIQTTVTRQFVCSHLGPEDADRLDRPVGFGGGLTDGTYWEWIDGKAKRIFLVLLDLGSPEHIFSVIDDSWDDSDLPIALDQVRRLGLAGPARDERRFYSRQFHYLVRPLRRGEHVVYSESEVVPIDVVDGGSGGSGGQAAADRVALPGFPDHVFCRRRIPIGSGPGCLAHEDFQAEADRVRGLCSGHLVSYFASYVHRGWGYVLLTPASDATLKAVLAGTTPPSLKALDKTARRELVMNWIHCLVDTLCYIHSRGLSHGSVRPSRVLLGSGNHISFSDLTRFDPELLASGASGDQARGGFDKEAYDYAAPEQWFRPSSSLGVGGAAVRRGTLTSTTSSGSGSGSGSSSGVADAFNAPESFSISRSWPQGSSSSSSPTQQAPTPHLDPQAADVFSLGCVILELLGFLLKRPSRAFAAHRAAKHKLAGRGGAVLDSSFHRNLGQVETWMMALGREAARGRDSHVLRGVAPLLRVVERMLAPHPADRPPVRDVQARTYCVLTEACGIREPHCVHAPYRAYSIGGGLKMGVVRTGGGGDGGDAGDAVSIAIPKRNSGSGRPSSSRSPKGLWDGQQQEASWAASPPASQPLGLAGGLLAIRNLQIRDKVRLRSTWQAPPAFAGMAVASVPVSHG
ncbi:hypothetical protein RB594_004349 [Gaeumannomyces avenae]